MEIVLDSGIVAEDEFGFCYIVHKAFGLSENELNGVFINDFAVTE